MADFSLKQIMSVFVALILGIVLIQVIANHEVGNTELSGVTNESIAMSSGTANVVINETIAMVSQVGVVGNCGLIDITFFGNNSNSTGLPNVNVSQHVNITGYREFIVSEAQFPADGDYNISYTFAARTGSTARDDLVSMSFFGNGTNNTFLSSVTIGTQVNFSKEGVITASSCHFSDGSYNTSYGYEGDLYVTDSKSRNLLTLNSLFFALVLFAVAVGGAIASTKGFTIFERK